MIGISLLSLGVAILLVSITVLSVTATRSGLEPAPSVVSFGGYNLYNPGADTLPATAACEGTLAGDWHSVELSRLSDAEAFLDSLEASQATTKTELEITGDDRFTVRWR